MGKIRAFAKHVYWSETELDMVRLHYPTATRGQLMKHFPGRSARQVQCKAADLGLYRPPHQKMSPEEKAKRKRENMARQRALDPEKYRQRSLDQYQKDPARRNAIARERRRQRFFANKGYPIGVPAKDLARLWKRQRGCCAISGVKLDRTAELDHIVPKSRGGTDALENLQWLTRAVNRCKRAMPEADFIAVCIAVAEHQTGADGARKINRLVA